eukprot:TRINITY_DN2444_c0_g2_i4.p2 TRINITY_DN2444_c0_g2~~TRINITY_DN2444_c0_g2_i4.p2  ORF type:complete len:158 (-),score=20.14 TRINITY_DN2444_c0_g2_i4:399-872(-)
MVSLSIVCQSCRLQKLRSKNTSQFKLVQSLGITRNQTKRGRLQIMAQQQQPSPTENQVEDAEVSVEQQKESASQEEEVLTEEEQKRLAALKQLKETRKERSKNILQGAFDETRLIEWPGAGSAVTNTFLVIGIVAGTSAMLFAINSLLVEVSNKFYG